MPDHLQSFQLDFLTPDLFQKIVKKAISQGIQLPAAHGHYINFHMGDMILVIRTAYDREKELDYITGFDSHAKGGCVWDCRIREIKEKEDITEKTLIVERAGELLPLPLINGDILPSCEPGDHVKAQVALYPRRIGFYEKEEAAKQTENLKRIHPEKEEDVDLWGKAVGFRRGETSYMGGTLTRFLVALIETEQGQVEAVFPDALVKEDQEEMLKPGVYIHAVGELAANPAILDLEKGYPKEGDRQ